MNDYQVTAGQPIEININLNINIPKDSGKTATRAEYDAKRDVVRVVLDDIKRDGNLARSIKRSIK